MLLNSCFVNIPVLYVLLKIQILQQLKAALQVHKENHLSANLNYSEYSCPAGLFQ